MKPSVLAFDLGRVVFDFDYLLAMESFKGKIAVPFDKISEDLFYNDFALEFEKGLVSPRDFYLKFKSSYRASLSYEEFSEGWSDIFYPKLEVIALAKRLKIIYPLYLISNINQLHFEHLYEKYADVFSIFDRLILSYKVKSVKPERAIYEELKKASGKDYREIVYIDDRKDLTDQAKKLKLRCITFKNYRQLIKRLASFGIVVPDGERENISLAKIKNICYTKRDRRKRAIKVRR